MAIVAVVLVVVWLGSLLFAYRMGELKGRTLEVIASIETLKDLNAQVDALIKR